MPAIGRAARAAAIDVVVQGTEASQAEESARREVAPLEFGHLGVVSSLVVEQGSVVVHVETSGEKAVVGRCTGHETDDIAGGRGGGEGEEGGGECQVRNEGR